MTRRGADALSALCACGWLACTWISALGPAAASPSPLSARVLPLDPIDPDELVVSSGRLARLEGSRFVVRSEDLRAQLAHTTLPAVALSFQYLGPSAHSARLASGELRRQIGVKLRAKDSCNVVYVMWHIDPSPGVEVSVKSNPTLHTHAECGDRGYTFVTPQWASSPRAIATGQTHTLEARLRGRMLEVVADGSACWRGQLPAVAFAFDGPVGVRTDNGEFELELRAAQKSSHAPLANEPHTARRKVGT